MLQCTPNDFLEWTPDAKDAGNDKHPLIPLQRSDKVIQLTQMLNSCHHSNSLNFQFQKI